MKKVDVLKILETIKGHFDSLCAEYGFTYEEVLAEFFRRFSEDFAKEGSIVLIKIAGFGPTHTVFGYREIIEAEQEMVELADKAYISQQSNQNGKESKGDNHD